MTPFTSVRRPSAVAAQRRLDAPRLQTVLAEPLEDRKLFSVVVDKPEPLNTGGTTYTGGITAPGPVATPTPTPSPTANPSPLAAVVPATDEDDQLAEARTLTVGKPITSHKIGYDTDVDMFKVNLVAGQIVGFDVDNFVGFSTFDGQLRIFDGLGAELDASDDDAGPNETDGLEPFLEFTAPVTGTFYVGVSGAPNDAYDALTGAGDAAGSFGPYILRADLLGEDDVDDQIGEAKSVKSDDTKDGQIFALTDVDMFRLSAKTGQRFLINVDARNGSGLDSALQIFDASGNLLAADYGGNTFVSFVAPRNGNFYIAISGNANINYDPFLGDYANDSFGSTGAYRLKVDKQ